MNIYHKTFLIVDNICMIPQDTDSSADNSSPNNNNSQSTDIRLTKDSKSHSMENSSNIKDSSSLAKDISLPSKVSNSPNKDSNNLIKDNISPTKRVTVLSIRLFLGGLVLCLQLVALIVFWTGDSGAKMVMLFTEVYININFVNALKILSKSLTM